MNKLVRYQPDFRWGCMDEEYYGDYVLYNDHRKAIADAEQAFSLKEDECDKLRAELERSRGQVEGMRMDVSRAIGAIGDRQDARAEEILQGAIKQWRDRE